MGDNYDRRIYLRVTEEEFSRIVDGLNRIISDNDAEIISCARITEAEIADYEAATKRLEALIASLEKQAGRVAADPILLSTEG